MTRERLETWLQRARTRRVPHEQLVGYTASVRRRLSAPTPADIPVRPSFGWQRLIAPVGVVVALLLAIIITRPAHRAIPLPEEAVLTEEVAILTTVAPEESLLPEDEMPVLEEEWFEQDLPHEIQI